MTENSEEIAELKRAHAALEIRFETILPTLATKADLEATASRILGVMHSEFSDMHSEFSDMRRQFSDLQPKMNEGFERIWRWLAGSLVTIIIALLGLFAAVLFRQPYAASPVAPPQPAVVNNFYPDMPPPRTIAPPSQP